MMNKPKSRAIKTKTIEPTTTSAPTETPSPFLPSKNAKAPTTHPKVVRQTQKPQPSSSSNSAGSSQQVSPQNPSLASRQGGVTLPLGEINVLIVTDTHSWVGGHGARQPQYNADYGAVLSFYQRLLDYCNQNNRTLFFVMNGDWVDGTGLAMNGDPSYLIPILQKMPWDAVNVGNHELYRQELIEYILRPGGFVESWEGKYLSSNVIRSRSKKPLGSNYRVLHGNNRKVLTFGFLYNMDGNAEIVTVKKVEQVLEEDWFTDALNNEDFDSIMVLAHMGFSNPLVQTILSKIREILDDSFPVQFVTGHTHVRNFTMLDPSSSSFEAGRYLDTVGFVSFPTQTTYSASSSSSNSLFQHQYIEANIDSLQKALGVSSLATENGQALTDFINQIRQDLNLDDLISCVKTSYYVDRSLMDNTSLWRLFQEQVVPNQFNVPSVVVMEKGSWRYDLLKGNVRIDDAIGVSPFNDTFVEFGGIPGTAVLDLNRSLNQKPDTSYLVELPNYIFVFLTPNKKADGNTTYNLITPSFEARGIKTKLQVVYPEAINIIPVRLNQTTTTIWMDYFRSHDLCSSSPGHTKKPHVPSTKSNSTGLGFFGSTEPGADTTRLIFVSIALATVCLLGSINIWQRERVYRRTVEARDRLTMDALQEYHDEEAEFENEHELL